ncbi:MAG: hypothetical protein AAGA54_18035 [Myxococcota bacterium]
MRCPLASCLALLLLSGCGDLVFGDTNPGPGDTGVVDDDDDGDGLGDCCEAQDNPGCDNPIISSCVCAMDPTCCEQGWDAQCAGRVESVGCGQCGAGGGDCCVEGNGPGCESLTVEDCVCAVDPFCCADAWDAQCVADVFLFECGSCPGTSSCCAADGTPGCADADVQQCVCGQDPACCIDGWDFQCVQEVELFGCGGCQPDTSSTGAGSTSTGRHPDTTSSGSSSSGSSSSSSSGTGAPGETDASTSRGQ